MRRLFQVIIPFFFLVAIVSSCQEEFLGDAMQSGTRMVHRTLYTCMDTAPATAAPTRVGLGKNLRPEWDADDSLSVFDGAGNNLFLVSQASGGTASFGGEVDENATTLQALYPYDRSASCSGGLLNATLPAVQTVADSVCHGALLCTAEAAAADGILSFRNAYSLVKVTISLAGVTSVTLRGNNSEKLAGPGSIVLSGDRSFVPGDAASSTVTLLPSGETFPKGSVCYIAVAPVEFTEGFEVILGRSDGAGAVRSTSKSLTLRRNQGVNLDDVATTLKWKKVISTKEELFAWNAGYGVWTADDQVSLGADIDMEGDAWTPHNFRGVFDGEGHRLYNFVCKSDSFLSGLFADLYGTVRNLVIGSSDGISWDGVSVVKHEYSGSESAWPNAGSVCGRMQTGSMISGVTNFATVELGEQDGKGRCRLGGITGFIANPGVLGIEDCINRGAVVNNSSSTTANQAMGGIVGSPERAVTLARCTNYGSITSNCEGVYYIGGIMGTTNGPAAINGSETAENSFVSVLEDCRNYGAVTANKGATLYVGGIAGALAGGALTGCENHGPVSAAVTDRQNNVGGIAGVFFKWNDSFLDGCSNDGEITGCSADAANNIGGIIGYISGGASAEVTLSSVVNSGKVHCSGSTAQSAAGGIAGRAEKAGCNFTRVSNDGEVYVDGTAAGQRNIGGICGVTTAATVYDGCVNTGDIHNASKAAQARIGGFFGHGNGFTVTCTSRQSVNSGKVYGFSAANDGAMGGISGYAQGGFSIQGTEDRPVLNSGVVNADDASARIWTGGITGYTVTGTNSVAWARNTGKVSKNNSYDVHCVMGGIMGRVNSSTVTVSHCINDGVVQDEGKGDNYRWVGGIVGRAFMNSGSITISDCTNNADISLRGTGNKKTNGFAIAGILGSGNRNCTVTRNVNNGAVSIFSGNAAANPHAAGIFGDDVDVDTKTAEPAANVITGNTNNGVITATGVANQARIGAGGIVGRMSYSSGVSTLSGNNSNGNVAASAGGTTLFGAGTVGGSGAVAGDMQTEAANTVTAAVSKKITVGGVSYDTALSIGALAAWLCPNSSKIEATYID